MNPIDFAILVQIASYWWSHKQLPFPSIQAIAEAIDISESTVKKHLADLEKAKLIKRIHRPQPSNRHKTNEYDFQPLIKAVTPYALQELEEIAERKANKLKKLSKKGKPALKVVPGK
ncbi:MAG: helix-turn-helix domain-containing protein [Betaproteobacteria bacterium]